MSETDVEPGQRPEPADKTGRTAQVFIRNVESGEPAYYCGPAADREAVRTAMGHIMASELEGAIDMDEDQDLCLEVWWMTPEEVEAIPSI